jgi:hypothetical protein
MKARDKFRVVSYHAPDVHAWVSWQASIERRSVSALIDDLLRQYHATCSKANPDTPKIAPE